MRKILLSLSILLFLWGSFACPEGCVCSGDTCDSCADGFFDRNPDPSIVHCAICPRGCDVCSPPAQAGEPPQCSDCSDGWTANQDATACFRCAPECDGCENTPDNCLACKPPFVSITSLDGTQTVCMEDHYCLIEGCAACDGTQMLLQAELSGVPVDIDDDYLAYAVTCAECFDGGFNFDGCRECNFPCTECSFDTAGDLFDTVVDPYWTELMANLTGYYTQMGIPEDQQPEVPQLYDMNTITDLQKTLWTKAYFIMKSMLETAVTVGGGDQMVYLLQILPLLPQIISTGDEQELLESVTEGMNGILQTDYDEEEIQSIIGDQFYLHVECLACAQNFFLDPNSGQCTRCAVPGCKSCNDDGTCAACKPGYWDDSGSCTACDDPCKTCSAAGDTSCTSCELPLTLTSANTCVQCDSPCRTCDPNDPSVCVTCIPPFNVEADGNGDCYRCDQTLCVDCETDDPTFCNQCREGFFSLDGQCIACPNKCQKCSAEGECDLCKDGFVEAEDGVCVQCSPGCQECDEDDPAICVGDCEDGFFFHVEEMRCIRCEPGCDECSIEGCEGTQEGKVIFNDEIIQCPNKGCAQCDPENPGICQECEDKFYLDGDKCKPCWDGCKDCDDDSSCNECRKGTYDDGSSCARCIDNCQKCSDGVACQICKRGYHLQLDNTCAKVCNVQGCEVCSADDPDVCQAAKPGYSIKEDGSIVTCLRGCGGSCDPKDLNICSGCSSGFQLADNQCVPCPRGCAECDDGVCKECMPDHRLVSDDDDQIYCKRRCPFPCAECEDDQCQECEVGYTLDGDHCVPEDCNPDCEFCVRGTYDNDADPNVVNCVECGVENCDFGDDVSCDTCMDGYYVNEAGDECLQCSEGCRICSGPNSCQLAAHGYYLVVLSMDEDEVVLSEQVAACSEKCQTCQYDAKRCTSCGPGYKLRDNKCINKYTCKIQLELDVDYATAMENSQCQDVLVAVAAQLQADEDDVEMEQCREASLVVGLSVSSSGQDDANQLSDRASQTDFGPVVGETVLASSATVNYDDSEIEEDEEEEEEGSGTSIGLIVGVVVGVIVLVAIVAFVVYKMKASKGVKVTQVSDNGSFNMDNGQMNEQTGAYGGNTGGTQGGLDNFKANYA